MRVPRYAPVTVDALVPEAIATIFMAGRARATRSRFAVLRLPPFREKILDVDLMDRMAIAAHDILIRISSSGARISIWHLQSLTRTCRAFTYRICPSQTRRVCQAIDLQEEVPKIREEAGGTVQVRENAATVIPRPDGHQRHNDFRPMRCVRMRA